MRLGALVPALALGAALVAPPMAQAQQHRSERVRRSANERSYRGRDQSHRPPRGEDRRGYRNADTRVRHRDQRHAGRGRQGYERHPRYPYRYARPYYPRPYSPPLVYAPPPAYYAPPLGYYGAPRPVWVPYRRYRGGVHGNVSIGLPFVGFSLYF